MNIAKEHRQFFNIEFNTLLFRWGKDSRKFLQIFCPIHQCINETQPISLLIKCLSLPSVQFSPFQPVLQIHSYPKVFVLQKPLGQGVNSSHLSMTAIESEAGVQFCACNLESNVKSYLARNFSAKPITFLAQYHITMYFVGNALQNFLTDILILQQLIFCWFTILKARWKIQKSSILTVTGVTVS